MEITVVKKSVKRTQPKLYSVTLNLVVKDGTTEVINQDFAENYRTGQSIADIVGRFKTKMQEVIDACKEEKQIFSAAQFDNAIIALKNNLVG